jgi:hypothetical protein
MSGLRGGNAVRAERDKVADLACENALLLAKIRALVVHGDALLIKMAEIEASPEYLAVWTTAQAHNGPYKGKTWEVEASDFKATVDAAKVGR